jgi:hypothetical protein
MVARRGEGRLKAVHLDGHISVTVHVLVPRRRVVRADQPWVARSETQASQSPKANGSPLMAIGIGAVEAKRVCAVGA